MSFSSFKCCTPAVQFLSVVRKLNIACLPCTSSLSFGNYTGKWLYKNSSANFLCAAVYFKSLLQIL